MIFHENPMPADDYHEISFLIAVLEKEANFENRLQQIVGDALWVKKELNAVVCLFDLILYVSSTIFQLCRDRFSWVKPVLR